MNDLMCKMRKSAFLGFILLLCPGGFHACSTADDPLPDADAPVPEQPSDPPSKAVKVVNMRAGHFRAGDAESRTAYELETDKLKFSWAENDRIGIYPSAGTQIAFSIKSGAGESSAVFDGGAWILSQEESYVAYYPYDASLTGDRTSLTFSYEGQCQQGNGSLAHLGKYDLMATGATRAADEKLNFDFDHLNCVAQLKLTVPVDTAFTRLTVRCNETPLFTKVAKLDLSGDTYAYTPQETTHSLEMSLTDVASTAAGQQLVFYLMLPPTDMSGKNVCVTLQSSDNKVYQGDLKCKNMQAGRAYAFAATLTDATLSSSVSSPGFGDSDASI